MKFHVKSHSAAQTQSINTMINDVQLGINHICSFLEENIETKLNCVIDDLYIFPLIFTHDNVYSNVVVYT
jgi:hypothetical protein